MRLEFFTVDWNSLEAVVALVAGRLASSIALVRFGLDSVIEAVSGLTLLWRFEQRYPGGAGRRVARPQGRLRKPPPVF